MATAQVEFRAYQWGLRPHVRVNDSGISAEVRFITRRSTTIPRAAVTGVDLQTVLAKPIDMIFRRKVGGQVAVLLVTSLTDRIEVRTEVATAEEAKAILTQVKGPDGDQQPG